MTTSAMKVRDILSMKRELILKDEERFWNSVTQHDGPCARLRVA